MAANLPGSGVLGDPYIIKTYEDFSKMDSLETGAYFKLVNDINMLGTVWDKSVNLNGGFLEMSDHKIEFPTVTADAMFSYGTIYAERAEYVDGIKLGEDKAGYILNVMGGSDSQIFKDVSFSRIGVSCLNINSNAITFRDCYFRESNIYYKSNHASQSTVISLGTMIDDTPQAIDTVFEIIYAPKNNRSMIARSSNATIERCLIKADIDRANLGATDSIFVKAALKDSIIYPKVRNSCTYFWWSAYESALTPSFLLYDTNDPTVAQFAYPGSYVATDEQIRSVEWLSSHGFNVEPEPIR